MFHIFFWLGLLIVFGLAYFGETKKMPTLFLISTPLLMFIGLMVMQEGITFDYGYSIQEIDANLTAIDYNLSKPFAITSTNDNTIYSIGQILFIGGILMILWTMYRTATWNIEDMKKKYSGEL